MEGTEFKFYCKPYFLRLNFACSCVEDKRAKSVYDGDTLTVHLPKAVAGEHFPNLSMLTTLLQPARRQRVPRPLIEVLGSSAAAAAAGSDDEGDGEGEEDEDDEGAGDGASGWAEALPSERISAAWQWDMPQHARADAGAELGGLQRSRYGFNLAHVDFFADLGDERAELLESAEADSLPPSMRRQARLAAEDARFDAEHYLADRMEPPDEIAAALAFRPWWADAYAALKSVPLLPHGYPTLPPTPCVFPIPAPGLAVPIPAGVALDEPELACLRELPSKEFLVSSEGALLCGLVDLLGAVAYDYRVTGGEGTVESAWTMARLSPTLSWLEQYEGVLAEPFVALMRRTLAYPLYRSWALADRVRRDVLMILCCGRVGALKALLWLRRALRRSETFYFFNELYVDDYCTWLQHLADATFVCFVNAALTVKVTRSDMGWQLDELEAAADAVADENGSA